MCTNAQYTFKLLSFFFFFFPFLDKNVTYLKFCDPFSSSGGVFSPRLRINCAHIMSLTPFCFQIWSVHGDKLMSGSTRGDRGQQTCRTQTSEKNKNKKKTEPSRWKNSICLCPLTSGINLLQHIDLLLHANNMNVTPDFPFFVELQKTNRTEIQICRWAYLLSLPIVQTFIQKDENNNLFLETKWYTDKTVSSVSGKINTTNSALDSFLLYLNF